MRCEIGASRARLARLANRRPRTPVGSDFLLVARWCSQRGSLTISWPLVVVSCVFILIRLAFKSTWTFASTL